MQLAQYQPRTPDASGMLVWPRRTNYQTPLALAGTSETHKSSIAVVSREWSIGTVAMQIANISISAAEASGIKNYITYVHDRPKATLSGVHVSTCQHLPSEVTDFAALHKLTGSVAVAMQTVKRLFPAFPVDICLDSDEEAGETVIRFTLVPPTGQDLDDLSEMNSRLHDEVFNSLPTKSLQFLSFGFRFE